MHAASYIKSSLFFAFIKSKTVIYPREISAGDLSGAASTYADSAVSYNSRRK